MQSLRPLFSIIIPTYNRAELIGKAIESALGQTHEIFELIVVDDGSTDCTAEVVKAFADSRVSYYKIDNAERGAARNYGAKVARGEYVNFFDSDDWMYPNHLATALALIKQHERPEVFHVAYEIRTPTGELVKQVNQFDGEVANYLILSNDLGCNSVFIRRDIALTNPFVEDRVMASSEDWELWLRLVSRYRFYCSNTITFVLVAHPRRSLSTISVDRIIARDELMLKLLLRNEYFKSKFSRNIPRFVADRYTFFTLNLALTKQRRVDTLKYLMKALRVDFSVITRKRFLASVKHWF